MIERRTKSLSVGKKDDALSPGKRQPGGKALSCAGDEEGEEIVSVFAGRDQCHDLFWIMRGWGWGTVVWWGRKQHR